MLVWTNDQMVHWVQSIGLRDYAGNLHESGVHGALLALDENFDHNTLALVLQIPTQNTQARQVMEREFNNLLALGTDRKLDDGEEKVFRRAPSWRKRFRPRDHHSGGMLGTSAETLPVGFRVSTLGPLQPPPAPPKKIMPEGECGAGRGLPPAPWGPAGWRGARPRLRCTNAAVGRALTRALCVFSRRCRLLPAGTAGAQRLEPSTVRTYSC